MVNNTFAETDSRLEYIVLRKNSTLQLVVFFAIMFGSTFLLFRFMAVPVSEQLFTSSFNASIEKEGEGLSKYSQWFITIEPSVRQSNAKSQEEEQAKYYYFDPLLSTMPVLLALGFVLAVVITTILPQKLGLVRQKIEREIINTLHRYAKIEYGEHTTTELYEIAQQIEKANLHAMHKLEERWKIPYIELAKFQGALSWRKSSALAKILHVNNALSVYMRNHFTMQYENTILGFIYIGAAILIIVIGLRGLQFIPKDRPSLVLFAISLEFILLILYAVSLIFTKTDVHPEDDTSSDDVHSILFGASSHSSSTQAERMLKMFVATPPKAQTPTNSQE